MKRPTSISVIGWYLILIPVISLIASTLSIGDPKVKALMERNPIPFEVQVAILYLGLSITILSGIGMLNGQNWARLLYVGWSAFGSAVGIATSPMKSAMIPGLVVFAVATFFLFRPEANAYFATKEGAVGAQRV
jgi:hypothetical protein